MESLMLIKQIDNNKAKNVPNAFVKECGVHKFRNKPSFVNNSHRPRKIGNTPESLAIDKIPPPTDSLTDKETNPQYIKRFT